MAQGFNLGRMGMGQLGGGDVSFKRKFRWLFAIQTDCRTVNNGFIPPTVVKLAARPNLTVEETEINFLHAKTWIPGKAAWETITVTYYDVGGSNQNGGIGTAMSALFSWLATVYDFTNPVNLHMSTRKGGGGQVGGGYAGTGTLQMLDGCGNLMETWILKNMWPQAINFGELDYSSSEEATIELTLRYSDVQYRAEAGCGAIIKPCCIGCT